MHQSLINACPMHGPGNATGGLVCATHMLACYIILCGSTELLALCSYVSIYDGTASTVKLLLCK